MDNWFHEHLTQILVHSVGEERVRLWGKNLSQHSFDATRHHSYLETKWTARRRSNSLSAHTKVKYMRHSLWYTHTEARKGVLKSLHITRPMPFRKGHNDIFEFSVPSLISCSTTDTDPSVLETAAHRTGSSTERAQSSADANMGASWLLELSFGWDFLVFVCLIWWYCGGLFVFLSGQLSILGFCLVFDFGFVGLV